jgi:hypothetical protein
MKTMHKLLLILIFIALFDFCGCTEETAQPEPGWQVIDFVWTKENGDKMTLSVTVPEEWDKNSVNTSSTGVFSDELYIDDKNALKQAGSHGIIAVLGDGQTLQDVEIDAGYPFGCLSTEYVTIGDTTYRKDNIQIDSKSAGLPSNVWTFANVYYFCVDNYVFDFFIYYSGVEIDADSYDHAQQEKILSSISISFS